VNACRQANHSNPRNCDDTGQKFAERRARQIKTNADDLYPFQLLRPKHLRLLKWWWWVGRAFGAI
jgi:hypothetical protein